MTKKWLALEDHRGHAPMTCRLERVLVVLDRVAEVLRVRLDLLVERIEIEASTIRRAGEMRPLIPTLDTSVPKDLLTRLAQYYEPERNFFDGMVSPLYGDCRGLPSIHLQVGADKLLRDDSVRFHEKFKTEAPVKFADIANVPSRSVMAREVAGSALRAVFWKGLERRSKPFLAE